ncbi:MAG: hypothetical protein KF852_16390, partial [Saprospiraceae bacterium]|nr:hypothetical protein [Saprospiraceae bacterium]
MKNRILLLIAFALLALAGCEKDRLTDLDAPDQDFSTGKLTVQQAKKWWDSNKPIENRSEDGPNPTPIWDQAVATKYRGVEDIVLVPFDWGDLLDLEERGRVLMVIFTEPQTQQIRVRWLGYYASSANYSHSLWQYNVNDFTGYFFEITAGGQIANILNIQNGVISEYHPGNIESAGSNGDVNAVEFRCDPGLF